MSGDDDTAADGLPRGRDGSPVDPSEMPTGQFATPAPAEDGRKAAVQAALEKAREGVDRSERLTAQRQAEAVSASRFGRFTKVRPGARPKLSQVFGDRIGRHRGRGPVLALLLLASLLAGVYALRGSVREAGVADARAALITGELDALREVVDGASGWARWLDHEGVLLAAEAVLFRFGDAEPERRARVLQGLEGKGGDSALLARALVSDVEARAALLNELQSAVQNPWVITASATALQQVGDTRVAQRNVARLVKMDAAPGAALMAAAQAIDPAHAGRLWETLAQRARGRNAWWRLASESLAPNQGNDLPPVAAAEAHFTRALQLLEDKKRREAERHLERVGQFVAYQPTFLVELATRMLDAGQPGAARQLLEQIEGEAGPYADVVRGRALLAEGETDSGLAALEQAWEAGSREPTLLRELFERGHLVEEAEIVEAFQRWPRNIELTLARGQQLLRAERGEEASQWLRDCALWLVPKASERQRARFFTVLATAEAARGNRSGAANYLAKALEAAPKFRAARRLAAELKADR